MKKTETKTLALAMDVLALNMPDGVATAAIAEAANRLLELDAENLRLKKAISETLEENAHLADGDVCTLIKLKRAAAMPNEKS